MGLPAYMVTNLAASAGLTGVNIASGFPLTNLIDGKLGMYTKWTGGGGSLNMHMLVNYNSMFIGNHSLVAGETFDISGNPALIPSASEASVWRSENIFVNFALLSPAYVANSPYINIRFNSVADPVTIGEIVVGARVAFPRNFNWTYPKKEHGLGVTNRTRSGVRTDYVFGKYRTFQPDWMFPESEYETFKAFNDAVRALPFVWIPDVAVNEAYYVRKDLMDFDPQPIGPAREAGVMQPHYRWAPLLCGESQGLIVT